MIQQALHTNGMTTFIAAFILLLLFGLILLWLFRLSTPGRRAALMAAADKLQLAYEPWHALEQGVRRAGFQILSCGENRYVPHYLEGSVVNTNDNTNDDTKIVAFDFTTTHKATPETQTLILMPCALQYDIQLLISPDKPPKPDCFTERRQLLPIERQDRPLPLEGRTDINLAASAPHKARPLLDESVCEWILSHPHLHIECAGGILLACQPGYCVDADELAFVINDVKDLINRLSNRQSKKPGQTLPSA